MIIQKEGKRIYHEFTCPACGCEFKASNREYKIEVYGSITFYYSYCPWCGSRVKDND